MALVLTCFILSWCLSSHAILFSGQWVESWHATLQKRILSNKSGFVELSHANLPSLPCNVQITCLINKVHSTISAQPLPSYHTCPMFAPLTVKHVQKHLVYFGFTWNNTLIRSGDSYLFTLNVLRTVTDKCRCSTFFWYSSNSKRVKKVLCICWIFFVI